MIRSCYLALVILMVVLNTCAPFRVRLKSFSRVNGVRAITRSNFLAYDPPIAFCEMKVGKILSVDPINNFADSFYMVTIDVGSNDPLEIHSNVIPDLEKWVDKLVVVLCNVDFTYKAVHSSGAIMSWFKSDSEAAVLVPPPDAAVGESIEVEGVRRMPPSELSFENNAYDKTIKNLEASQDGRAMYLDKALRVSSGPVMLDTVKIPANPLRLKKVDVNSYLPDVKFDEDEEEHEDMDEDDKKYLELDLAEEMVKAGRARPQRWGDRDRSARPQNKHYISSL